jgi:transposase
MTLNRVPAAVATCRCECGCATRVPRYPTDLTDAQWAVLEPLLPVPLCLTPLGGRPEQHHRRAMIDAIFYLVDNGIKWRALPADFPPWKTVYGLCARWKQDGVLADITDLLRARVRRAAGRDPEPSAAIMDSQSVRESAEGVVPAATSGYDGSKMVNGRKRHLLTDTLGLLITVAVTAANVPDRAGQPSCCAGPAAAAGAAWPGPGATAPTQARTGPAGPAASSASPSRSSGGTRPSPGPSPSCPAAGSSSGPTPGSAAAGAAPATTNACPPTTRPWSTGPPSSR